MFVFMTEGVVAKWLVRWTPDQTVWVQALALHCVFGQDTYLHPGLGCLKVD